MSQLEPIADDSAPRVEQATRVSLRPIASPVPLGMLALAMGSLLLTALQLTWVPVSDGAHVATAVLAFVVPLEFVAALMAFLARDVVMATAFGLLTGSWASVGVLLLSLPAGGTSKVLGVLAVGAAAALLVPAGAASPTKPFATAVMIVAATRFAVTGVYELGASQGWRTVAGVIGIVLLACSLYGSFALALEDARHHTVLPITRRSSSRAAMSGRFADQMSTLQTEAGVRQES